MKLKLKVLQQEKHKGAIYLNLVEEKDSVRLEATMADGTPLYHILSICPNGIFLYSGIPVDVCDVDEEGKVKIINCVEAQGRGVAQKEHDH